MAAQLPPGIGNDQQAMQATAAMRQMPWYVQWLKQQGLNPNDPTTQDVKLTAGQQKSLLDAARANGIGISDSYMVNENGQIVHEGGHKLRNVLIGAGIAGAALTGLGAAGIGPLSGLLGGAGAATEAGSGLAGLAGEGAAAGVLPSTAIGTGMAAGLPAGLTGAGSGLAGLAGAGSAAATGGSFIDKILGTAGTIGKVGQTAAGIGSVLGGHTGDPELDAFNAANKENQMAKNRLLETQFNQQGPSVDRTAYGNAARASLLAHFAPSLSADNGFGKKPITVDPSMQAFAQSFYDKLNGRLAAGKPLTLSGVPDPTQEELDARQRAEMGANGQTGNGFIDTIGKVARVGGAVPGLIDAGRKLAHIWM